ncbi:MAG: orotate phosphoribosyltransferase [Saprospiraceae bacterium]|nr:orotate phosphoribosyltransferase [Saprospiraceae bacterium]
MDNIERVVARLLLQINAIKLSSQMPFTWASGLKSPIYCDNRLIPSYPEVRKVVVNGFVEKAKAFEPFDVVAGIATGGIPYGALLADRLDLPFVYVRSKAKEYGRQNLVEGELPSNARVLVIEDLISTGGSSLAAVEAIRAEGCQVIAVLAVFTYGFEQATQAFAAANCPLDTLTNYPILLEEALKTNYIQVNELATLQEWRQNPKAWSDQFLL